jgi:hypothetical protein
MSTAYFSLLKKKRVWTPIAIEKGTLLSGGEATIEKALSLSCLEMDVAKFLTESMKGDLPDTPGVRELLTSNANDEERHDKALNYAKAVHPISEKTAAEAARIQSAWNDLDIHPVVTAAFLERSVFFVILPIFRFLGDVGLRTTAADISRDETIHTASHSMVAHDLKAAPTKQLNALRRATVDWMTSDLDAEHDNRYLSKNFWLRQSDVLFKNGVAPEMMNTRSSRQPAFFESSNVNLPSYA